MNPSISSSSSETASPLATYFIAILAPSGKVGESILTSLSFDDWEFPWEVVTAGSEGGGIITGNGGNGIIGEVDGLPRDLLISESSTSKTSIDSSSDRFISGSREESIDSDFSRLGITIFSRPVKIRSEARARSTVPPAIL